MLAPLRSREALTRCQIPQAVCDGGADEWTSRNPREMHLQATSQASWRRRDSAGRLADLLAECVPCSLLLHAREFCHFRHTLEVSTGQLLSCLRGATAPLCQPTLLTTKGGRGQRPRHHPFLGYSRQEAALWELKGYDSPWLAALEPSGLRPGGTSCSSRRPRPRARRRWRGPRSACT